MAAVGNFRVEPDRAGARLWTETWALLSGPGARIAFGAYWLAIGPLQRVDPADASPGPAGARRRVRRRLDAGPRRQHSERTGRS